MIVTTQPEPIIIIRNKPSAASVQKVGFTLLALLFSITVKCQHPDSSQKNASYALATISDKQLKGVGREYQTMNETIEKKNQTILDQMKKSEQTLQAGLPDNQANQIAFKDITVKYQKLQNDIQSTAILNGGINQKLKSYVPRLDSMQTALKYLQAGHLNIPADKLKALTGISSQISQIQTKFQVCNEVQNFLTQREELVKQQMFSSKVSKYLSALNKQRYYYEQQIAAIKSELNDKDRIKQQLISYAASQPSFQRFWQKNSILGSIFPIPAGPDTSTSQALSDLQTKKQVGNLVQERLGKSSTVGASTTQNEQADRYLQEKVQQGKSEMDIIKNKVSQVTTGAGASDMTMPNFTPNNQKTKTFLKRLDIGFDIQNTPTSTILPATTNIALTVGYRFNDKITAGFGLAYLLGWGSPVKDIHFSNQGIGIRSFADVKAKGSFYVSGGFEYNYMQAFASLNSIKNLDIWQKSILLGLTKKYKIGSKTAKIQLLYNFLAFRQIPNTSPLVFRVGYSF